MIVSLHVATGAAAGTLVRSRRLALPVGLVLHGLGDAVPHQDIQSRGFELLSGAGALAFVAAMQGISSPAVVGAIAASCPDVEHVLRLPRPGGRKLYPTHRFHSWHRSGGLRASTQVFAAGVILGLLVRN